MTSKTMVKPPAQEIDVESTNGTGQQINNVQNGSPHSLELGYTLVAPPADRAHLPTFPMDVGFRHYTDPETGQYCRAPLTLIDIYYPTEEDVGVVFMAEGPLHDIWSVRLTDIIRTHMDNHQWLTLHDVLIYWEQEGVQRAAPDLAIIPGGRLPDPTHQSYHVGRDGPIPIFVVEITSKTTRNDDLNMKPILYASVGIKEYLIIDIRTPKSKDWRLIGYRLEQGHPEYRKLKPDADGGLIFETVGLRFVAVKRSRINVYDISTGERLLTLEEQIARAESAEKQVADLQAEIARLRAQGGTIKSLEFPRKVLYHIRNSTNRTEFFWVMTAKTFFFQDFK